VHAFYRDKLVRFHSSLIEPSKQQDEGRELLTTTFAFNMTSFHIIGDTFVDLVCFLKCSFPEPGGDAELQDPVKTIAGGSGLNTSTHLQSLLRYRNSSCLQTNLPSVSLYTVFNPEDDYGKLITNHSAQHSLNLVNCRSQDSTASTGHCLAIVADQERSFMTHRGCIAEFAPNHVKIQPIIACSGPIHLHIAGYYNMPLFWNDALLETLTLIRQERDRNQKISTISMVPQHDASGQWDGGIDRLISSCLDFILLNTLEARRIIGRNNLSTTPGDHEMIDRLDEWMMNYSKRLGRKTIIVVTRGPNGAIAFGNGQILAELERSVDVPVIDPTGAGDAFAAGFIEGIWAWQAENQMVNDDAIWPQAAIEQGLMWGCATGTASVQIKGASVPADYSTILSIFNTQKGP
jgi:sugar/nucleoside kinase (ribokinase family)